VTREIKLKFSEKINEKSNLDSIRSRNRKNSNFSFIEFESTGENKKITIYLSNDESSINKALNLKAEKCPSSNAILEIKQKNRPKIRGKSS